MKQLLIVLMLLPISLFAKSIIGNKVVISQIRLENIDFDSIIVQSQGEIEIHQAKTNSIVLESDANVINHIQTTLSGKCVNIYFDTEVQTSKSKIIIYINNLKLLSAKACGSITSKSNILDFPSFHLTLHSIGNVALGINTELLDMKIEAVGEVDMKGKATNLDAMVNGVGTCKLDKLKVDNATINSSSISSLYLNVENEISLFGRGISNLRIDGSPNFKRKDIDKSVIIVSKRK